MQTNLSYILLFFCFFFVQIGFSQDIKPAIPILKKDTIPTKKRGSLFLGKKDSLFTKKKDTIPIEKPKESIEDIITHVAKDYTIQNAKDKLERQRATRKRVQKLRIDNARTANAGASVGALGSSSVQGALGSSTANAGGDIGFSQAIGGANFGIASAQNRAATAINKGNEKAATYNTIASVSSLFGNVANNQAAINTFKAD